MSTCGLLIALLFFIQAVYSQVQLQWAARYSGPGNDADAAFAIAVDNSGNVYVTGASPGTGTDRDYATLKYGEAGNLIWAKRFATKFFELGRDLFVDDSANVYVTGGSVTLKYSTSGDSIWTVENNAECFRILMNDSGQIYVAGTGFGDGVIKKIDRGGAIIWERTYNSPANDRDGFNDMEIDMQGNVIGTGQSRAVNTQWDYLTIKYEPDGDTSWVRRYNGPAPPQEVPTDIAFGITADDSGNAYVTGWSDGVDGRPQCLIIKYSPTGETLWERRYPASGTIGYVGYDILYDPAGFLYVATRANGFDDTLLKYDRNGNLLWAAVYQANHTFATNPPRLVRDRLGNIYMSSTTYIDPHAYYVVLKYSPTGVRLWEYRYRPPGTTFTVSNAYALCVDSSLNVYVTGESAGGIGGMGRGFDYLTLKLSQEPTIVEPREEHLPATFVLHQNYPNPFNPTTAISFDLPQLSHVKLVVVDVLGREVATLESGFKLAGTYESGFDASSLASGIYVYRLQAGSATLSRKMIIMK